MLPRSCMQTHRDCLIAEKAEAIAGKKWITDHANPEGNGPKHSKERGRRGSTGPPQPEQRRQKHHRVQWRVPPARSIRGPRPWFVQMQKPKQSGFGINLQRYKRDEHVCNGAFAYCRLSNARVLLTISHNREWHRFIPSMIVK